MHHCIQLLSLNSCLELRDIPPRGSHCKFQTQAKFLAQYRDEKLRHSLDSPKGSYWVEVLTPNWVPASCLVVLLLAHEWTWSSPCCWHRGERPRTSAWFVPPHPDDRHAAHPASARAPPRGWWVDVVIYRTAVARGWGPRAGVDGVEWSPRKLPEVMSLFVTAETISWALSYSNRHQIIYF